MKENKQVKGAKEFYEYCVEHPEAMEKLRSMNEAVMAAELDKLGFAFTKEEFQAFVEQSENLMDEQLAEAISGGLCTGHCGSTCEKDSPCIYGKGGSE